MASPSSPEDANMASIAFTPSNDPNLPYQTLNNHAHMEEYTQETASGEIDVPDIISEKTHPPTPFDYPLDPTGTEEPNLPYRTLSRNARMQEYTAETVSGRMDDVVSLGSIKTHKLVTFRLNDAENPKNWSKPYKWYCTMVVAVTCFVVAFNSSVITADLEGVMQDLNASREESLLSIFFFVLGFGLGSLLLL